MDWLLGAGGVILIVVAMVDAVWTTLSTAGGGPLTARLSPLIWRTIVIMQQRSPGRRHGLLMMVGTLNLLMIIFIWIALLWAGWTLLFSIDPTSVLDGQTHEAADLSSRIYFTGYTLFTLGVGNFVPNGDAWEVLTAAASLNGLFAITLSITYLVPVVSAAAEKRQLAAVISDLGGTPVDILRRAWTGTGFDGLDSHLSQIVPMLEGHTERHAAYPILHYFHSPTRRSAISPNIAALDEALTLLTNGIDPDVRLAPASVMPVKKAISGLLATIYKQYIELADEPPPFPDLRVLEEAGIPVIDDESFRRVIRAEDGHRRLLRSFVENDAWEWMDVWRIEEEEEK